MLAVADAPRKGDLDGRGNLSQSGLQAFCEFFLETLLGQIEYMSQQLQLEKVERRLLTYFEQREAGVADESQLKNGSAAMMRYVWLKGRVSRGELLGILSCSERTARDVLKGLLNDKVLASDSDKGEVYIKLPYHLVMALFPKLFPMQ